MPLSTFFSLLHILPLLQSKQIIKKGEITKNEKKNKESICMHSISLSEMKYFFLVKAQFVVKTRTLVSQSFSQRSSTTATK
jgi:hypothetical protein